MGKTFRKNNSGSQSESYHADKNRDFAKKKKRHTHGQVRRHNKKCDTTEDNVQNTKSISKLMKHHWASAYSNEMNNLISSPYQTLEAHICYHEKWQKSDGDILDTIDTRIKKFNTDDGKSQDHDSIIYLKATRKQIIRRGKASVFRGHRNE